MSHPAHLSKRFAVIARMEFFGGGSDTNRRASFDTEEEAGEYLADHFQSRGFAELGHDGFVQRIAFKVLDTLTGTSSIYWFQYDDSFRIFVLVNVTEHVQLPATVA